MWFRLSSSSSIRWRMVSDAENDLAVGLVVPDEVDHIQLIYGHGRNPLLRESIRRRTRAPEMADDPQFPQPLAREAMQASVALTPQWIWHNVTPVVLGWFVGRRPSSVSDAFGPAIGGSLLACLLYRSVPPRSSNCMHRSCSISQRS